MLNLGIWPGHKLCILKAMLCRKKLYSNYCFNGRRLAAKSNTYISGTVGGNKRNRWKVYMKNISKEVKPRESNTVFCPEPVKASQS